MSRPVNSMQKQHGAIAVIVGIALVALIFMIGLVVDLGFLYTRKTELQNAADAAALAGAKELKGTAASIDAAVAKAKELAAANSVDFGGNSITINDSEIEFGPSPGGPWSDVTTSKGSPKDKSFIRVDTSGILQGSHPTWFMHVTGYGVGGINSTTTYGMAVAGAYTVAITPLAACALDGSDGVTPKNACKTGQCGYELGKGYKLSEVNPLGPGTIYWIDATSTQAGTCTSSSTAASLPYVCQGKISAAVALAPQVFTNTGVSNPSLEALDSRFNSYDPSAHCDPATAPPDLNIKEYRYSDANVAAWMNPKPEDYVSPTFVSATPPKNDGKCKTSQGECQASRVVSSTGNPPVITTDYGGVVWSFVRPQGDIPSTSSSPAGRDPVAASYPATGTPYENRSDSKFYLAPSGHAGAFERRVLNLLIVSCPTAGGSCRPANVLAYGRFLMQRKANVPGDKDIYLEFGGLVFGGISPEIKLYR